MKLAPYLKAIYAMAVAGLGSIEVASIDGHFTARELIHAGVVTLAALGVTFAVPNLRTSDTSDTTPSTSGLSPAADENVPLNR